MIPRHPLRLDERGADTPPDTRGLEAALADKAEDRRLKHRELDIKSFEAETERLELQQRAVSPPSG